MQFKIQVAERETGEESEIRLDALTVQQARAKANEAGYLVSAIEPVGSTPSIKPVDALPPSRPPAKNRAHPKPGQPDAPMAIGSILGLILGAIIGYTLGGPLGIFVGAVSGVFAGMGIAAAAAPSSTGSKLSSGGRLALGGIASVIAVAIFFGFCIVPLNWWNGLWSSGTSSGVEPSYKSESPSYTPYRSKVDWSDRSLEEQEFLTRTRNMAREEYRQKGKSIEEADREFDRSVEAMERAIRK